MRRRCPLLALALIAVPAAAREEQADWRLVATQGDRVKLRRWERAWNEGLAAGRADAAGAAAMASDRALFDPFAAIDDPLPPAGAYRCRTVKLGGHGGGAAVAIGEWGQCRLAADAVLLHVERLDGGQRPTGHLYADAARRGVFLGTLSLGEERHPAPYGHAAGRDLAGVIERIGPARWRLIVPYPPLEAALYLFELVPDA